MRKVKRIDPTNASIAADKPSGQTGKPVSGEKNVSEKKAEFVKEKSVKSF